jgi:erythromycin esterase
MAENVAWILEQNPKAKIVLWAHNGHVAKQAQAMGKHLDERFGDKHLAIAFATSKGKYQAIARGKGLSEHELVSPPAGSAEDIFRRTGMPRFVLDLRKAKSNSDESGWFAKPTLFRRIGALAVENQFGPQNLREAYDAVIYIEETSRAKPIAR